MGKKPVKVNLAMKARLEAEAAERNAAKAAKAANGNSGVKHKTAAEMRASAERKQRESNEAAAKIQRDEMAALVLSDEAREAAKAASDAAAAASSAAASAARAMAAARIAQDKLAAKKASQRYNYSRKFHRNNPKHGQVQELSERELASMKRGGRRTRRR